MKYLALIGNPISHSLSPDMHNGAFRAQGLNYTYLPFQVEREDLRKALLGFEALQVEGGNVTIPHKVAIMPYLDQIREEAVLIGAVNTIHYQDGEWIGYNTDGIGFLRSLQQDGGVDPTGARILILGAGGASRAVAVQLGLAGAQEIVIANRTVAKGEELAQELAQKVTGTQYRGVAFESAVLEREMQQAEILINATSIGMVSSSVTAQTLPIQQEWIRSEQVIADLVYRPRETSLIRMGRTAGAKVLTGEGMLLYQGVEAYRIWTGIEPPVELMREILVEKL